MEKLSTKIMKKIAGKRRNPISRIKTTVITIAQDTNEVKSKQVKIHEEYST